LKTNEVEANNNLADLNVGPGSVNGESNKEVPHKNLIVQSQKSGTGNSKMNTDMKIDSTANELNGYSAKANQARATDENQEHKSDEEECENMGPRLPHHINANVIQMAVINKMLPKGFKFDLFEIVKRQSDMH
jgi:hypothetical protein